MTLIPFPHQIDSFNYCMKHNYVIVALQQGLGKSAVAQMVQDATDYPMLVICPSYLKYNWKNEYQRFFPNKIVDVFHTRKSIYEPFDTDIAIISYSFLPYAECLFNWAKIICVDEAHMVSNMEANRTKLIHQYVYEHCPEKLLLLTGTPIQNRVKEFYSLISLCGYDPKNSSGTDVSKIFPTEYDFADRFSHRKQFTIQHPTNPYKNQKVVKWYGLKDEQYLKQLLQGKYIRKKMDECLSLPPFIYKDVVIDNQNFPGLLSEFESFSKDPEMSSAKSPIKKMAAMMKAPLTVEYVRGLIDEGLDKVLIYSDHPDAARAIGEALNFPVIDGSTTTSFRQKCQDDFQKGGLIGISATIETFSTGVTLIASNNLVLNDWSWVPGRNDQVIFRIRRIGQTKECIIHRMIGSPQDAKILAANKEKENVIQRAT